MYRDVRLVAQEGFSESWAHLLTPYQIRWVPGALVLFSIIAGGESLAHYKKKINTSYSVNTSVML